MLTLDAVLKQIITARHENFSEQRVFGWQSDITKFGMNNWIGINSVIIARLAIEENHQIF